MTLVTNVGLVILAIVVSTITWLVTVFLAATGLSLGKLVWVGYLALAGSHFIMGSGENRPEIPDAREKRSGPTFEVDEAPRSSKLAAAFGAMFAWVPDEQEVVHRQIAFSQERDLK